MASSIGRSISIALNADTTKFAKNLSKSERDLKAFKDGVARVSTAMKASFVAMGSAAVAFGVSAVKAALADQKAQRRLAVALKNTTGATKAQIKGIEKYITKTSMATGVVDDKLRPAFQRLTQATKNTKKAQDLMSLALDVSAGTGKDLETVANALGKAYGGNLTSLQRLGIGLDKSIIKSGDTKKAFEELSKTFKGQSSASAESLEGRFARLQVAFDETKENIGVALLPAVERISTFMTKTGVPAIEGFVGAFTGSDGKDLDGIAESAYNLGTKLKNGLKYIIDHKDTFAAFAVAWAGFWTANKALIVTQGITSALAAIRGAMALTTVASATAATAEAAATGGASLIPALGAMSALALYFGIKKFGWRGGEAPKITKSSAAQLPGTTTGSQGTNGTGYSAPTYQGNWGTSNILGPRSLRGETTVNNVINLNGIVDAESARRSIESILQQSSLRTGPVTLTGYSI